MSLFVRDLLVSVRSLRRQPGYSTAIIACLTLGLAGTVAIVSILSAIHWRPLPYPQAERLSMLGASLLEPGCGTRCTRDPMPDEVQAWREHAAFQNGIATIQPDQRVARFSGAPLLLEGAQVSKQLPAMLDVQVILGRSLVPADFQPASGSVLLLGHSAWVNKFGADSSIVGQDLLLGDHMVNVVGILSPTSELGTPLFSFNVRAAEYLLPDTFVGARPASFWRAIALRHQDATHAQFVAELDRVLQHQSGGGEAMWAAAATPLRQELAGRYHGSFGIMLGAVGLVLLIACANVAGLMLARVNDRLPELSLRMALGASRRRLMQLMSLETLVLVATSGVLALLLVYWAEGAVRLLPPEQLPFWTTIGIDWRVVAAGVAIALLAALLLSATSAAVVYGRRLSAGIAESRGTGRGRSRTRQLLVVSEVAFAVVLLTVAGLLIQLLAVAEGRDIGMARSSLLYVSLADPGRTAEAHTMPLAFAERLDEEVRNRPGIVAVAVHGIDFGTDAPSQGPADGSASGVMVEGRAELLPFTVAPGTASVVSDGYFETVGIRLTEGRLFSRDDAASSGPVAILDEATARRLFPDGASVGRRMRIVKPGDDQPWLTVVGVVSTVTNDPLTAATRYSPQMYRPLRQIAASPSTVMVRTAGPSYEPLMQVREAIARADPDLPVARIISIEDAVGSRMWSVRFNTALLSGFAAFALVLTALGIYATVAYAVSQRRRELAVRMALGATVSGVVRKVVHGAVFQVTVGIVAGGVVAAGAVQLLQSMLHGTRLLQPLVYAAVLMLMIVVAVVASYIPARRIGTVEPFEALRAE